MRRNFLRQHFNYCPTGSVTPTIWMDRNRWRWTIHIGLPQRLLTLKNYILNYHYHQVFIFTIKQGTCHIFLAAETGWITVSWGGGPTEAHFLEITHKLPTHAEWKLFNLHNFINKTCGIHFPHSWYVWLGQCSVCSSIKIHGGKYEVEYGWHFESLLVHWMLSFIRNIDSLRGSMTQMLKCTFNSTTTIYCKIIKEIKQNSDPSKVSSFHISIYLCLYLHNTMALKNKPNHQQ